MLAEHPKSLAVCLQAHQDMIDHTGLLPHTVTCPFGLTETAIPVKLGTDVIGYLRIGQVLRHTPAKADTNKVTRELERAGLKFSGELRKAWERNPLIPPDKYNAIVRLLSFFRRTTLRFDEPARGRDAKTPSRRSCKRARDYIDKHKTDALSLSTVAQAAGASVFHFCKVFQKSTGLKFTDYVARVRAGGRANAIAQSESPHQRSRIRRRLPIAHPIQPHVQTGVRPVAYRISRSSERQRRGESFNGCKSPDLIHRLGLRGR